MKLSIHCGLHKTATTSFQTLCDANRALLYDLGVYYPNYDARPQHSYVLWDVQKSGLNALRNFLSQSFAEAKTNCHTVLLSGEDFENCIVDIALALEIETLAIESGFDAVEWVVVTRPVESYIASLYSELSKHSVVLRRGTLERAAKERGCFYISTNRYNYIFVFDFKRFAERFQQHVSRPVIEYSMGEFARGFPGAILLQGLLREEAFTRFSRLAKIDNQIQNESLDSTQIEVNYVSSTFGVGRLRAKRFRLLLAPLIWLRKRDIARRNADHSN
ncbi:hypothetical protein ROA7450_02448 [Roseovarius albus]|uniref:Uncharacterized protein n=1 Tax=Roseovarius albus TaxID=1247867 RepID=A0A1X6ZH14_9RHOB|nr:hypothetical protein [Roseovarius albus]SLN49513.1 hypothetical protein ROA7450_02448 [Roseovarius albus]